MIYTSSASFFRISILVGMFSYWKTLTFHFISVLQAFPDKFIIYNTQFTKVIQFAHISNKNSLKLI